jgi:hypothetical protein
MRQKPQPEFQLKLLAGENGLDNVVTWVHMVEGEEISRFLEGGEVAFTTGIALSGVEELIGLVKNHPQNGASGLVIQLRAVHPGGAGGGRRFLQRKRPSAVQRSLARVHGADHEKIL